MRTGSRRVAHGDFRRQQELQLSVFVRAGDTFAGRPLHREILDRARRAGLRGATAVRGLQGFGASGSLRAPGLTGLTGHEPVLIVVTDDATRVRAFVAEIDQLPGAGLIVLQSVVTLRRDADVGHEATSAPA
ncbi:MAG TPA: DUF190 domain-containing protein [Streptosporangiaceae bacterium]|nr:DUF190 domain-containing protein [Streptosporangiaceae bacterium]